MLTGWRFLAIAGAIILIAVVVVRVVLAMLERRSIESGEVSERWLESHRADPRVE